MDIFNTKKPNFFIIGAPKCGTTALSEYLRAHPNIFMCTPKEPNHFAPDFPTPAREKWKTNTLSAYLALFQKAKHSHIAIGEASVYYLYSSIAPKSIYKFNPKAKIIIMIRNPIDLICSYHLQMLYSSRETEKNLQRAWNLQQERKQGRKIPVGCPNAKFLDYDFIGKCSIHIEKWLDFFPNNQVKIILFDDFIKDTKSIYKDVLNFLDVPFYEKENFEIINSKKQYRNQIIGNLINTISSSSVLLKGAKLVKKITGKDRLKLIKTLRQINTTPVKFGCERLDPSFKFYLRENFKEEINNLSKLTDKDLSDWYNF